MKQHSYSSYNIELQHRLRRYQALLIQQKQNDISLEQEEMDEMDDIERELNLGGKLFPRNQTLWNFFDYLLVPTLVYELEYPRTSR
jgi:sterol O-acyltransferase